MPSRPASRMPWVRRISSPGGGLGSKREPARITKRTRARLPPPFIHSPTLGSASRRMAAATSGALSK